MWRPPSAPRGPRRTSGPLPGCAYGRPWAGMRWTARSRGAPIPMLVPSLLFVPRSWSATDTVGRSPGRCAAASRRGVRDATARACNGRHPRSRADPRPAQQPARARRSSREPSTGVLCRDRDRPVADHRRTRKPALRGVRSAGARAPRPQCDRQHGRARGARLWLGALPPRTPPAR